jgi:hypothetical protein
MFRLHGLLKQDNIHLIPDDASDETVITQVKLYDELQSGALLCRALNNLMLSNPSFVEQNLPSIDINERLDTFASLTNLNNFVRTCELYFNVDRTRLFEPVDVLKSKSEEPFIQSIYFLTLVVQEIGIHFPVQFGAVPHVSLTFDQLSDLVTMLAPKSPVSGGSIQVAYDPRVVMSFKDTEAFKTLSEKVETLQNSLQDFPKKSLTQDSSTSDELASTVSSLSDTIKNFSVSAQSSFADVTRRMDELNATVQALNQTAQAVQQQTLSTIDETKAIRSAFQSFALTQGKTNGNEDTKLDVDQLKQTLETVQTLSNANTADLKEIKTMMEVIHQSIQASNLNDTKSRPGPSSTGSLNDGQPTPASRTPQRNSTQGSSVPTSRSPLSGTSVRFNAEEVALNTSRTASTSSLSPSSTSALPSPVSPTTSKPMFGSTPQPSSAPKIFKLPDEVLNKNLSKEEQTRQRVIYEIIESEADYVRDLNMMIDVSRNDGGYKIPK